MTLLLGIDDVIFNWDMTIKDQNGFSDWIYPEPHMMYTSYYSPEMIRMMESYFGDQIRWLDDWCMDDSAQILLPIATNIGIYPNFVAQLLEMIDQNFSGPGLPFLASNYFFPIHMFKDLPPIVLASLRSANSWKLNCLALGLFTNILSDKIIMVGHNLVKIKRQIFNVVEAFDSLDRFRLYSTKSCWIKSDIEDAYIWMNK